ncbi:hypothetical protein ECSTECDG1313_0510 [Escherichia coli STEC_DG131-3]|nr:hypothetical protein ECSTECDG1313_0510 [Escherichia coli STEC_DG131-3]
MRQKQTQNCLMRCAYQYLQHIMQHFELARFCRPDKAFTPHPAFCARGWLYH